MKPDDPVYIKGMFAFSYNKVKFNDELYTVSTYQMVYEIPVVEEGQQTGKVTPKKRVKSQRTRLEAQMAKLALDEEGAEDW